MKAIVKIQRGRYSHYFQVARAMLSAASAVAATDSRMAIVYIDAAMLELRNLKVVLGRDMKR